MQKILATLKSRKEACWLAIFVAFLIIVIICQYMDRLGLQISNEKLQKTVEEQQESNERLQTRNKWKSSTFPQKYQKKATYGRMWFF